MKKQNITINVRSMVSALMVGLSVLLISCSSEETGSKEKGITTLETFAAEDAVKDYGQDASHEHELDVKQAMNELDSEIRELEIRIDKMEGLSKQKAEKTLERLKQKADELENEFDQKKWEETKREASDFFKDLGDKIEAGFEDLGNEIESTLDQ